MHPLMDCARIATSTMGLRDREDYMQEAILDVIEKGIAEREKAYIIRSMKNRIYDIFRYEKRQKRGGTLPLLTEPSVEDRYSFIETFAGYNPQNVAIALCAARDGFSGAVVAFGVSRHKVIITYYKVFRRLKEEICGKNYVH